jgi:hypothetical protein
VKNFFVSVKGEIKTEFFPAINLDQAVRRLPPPTNETKSPNASQKMPRLVKETGYHNLKE